MTSVVTYWRDALTDTVYKQEVWDDGTIANEQPVSSSLVASEMDFFAAGVAAEQALEVYTQVGIEIAEGSVELDPETPVEG